MPVTHCMGYSRDKWQVYKSRTKRSFPANRPIGRRRGTRFGRAGARLLGLSCSHHTGHHAVWCRPLRAVVRLPHLPQRVPRLGAPARPSASAYGPSLGMAGVHSPQRARTTPARPSLVSRSIRHRARPLACSHARALTQHGPALCPCSVSCFAGLRGSCSVRVHRDLRAAALAACAP